VRSKFTGSGSIMNPSSSNVLVSAYSLMQHESTLKTLSTGTSQNKIKKVAAHSQTGRSSSACRTVFYTYRRTDSAPCVDRENGKGIMVSPAALERILERE
jgi:hypothetical protein